MSRFGGRITDLERRFGGSECPECGWGSGKQPEIRLAGSLARGEVFDPRPCSTCGRPRGITLRLGDADDDVGPGDGLDVFRRALDGDADDGGGR